MSVVSAERLTKTYGSVTAIRDVSFEVDAGSILGLIGPSGGGKTTLLRLLCGLESPSKGSASCLGVATRDLRRSHRARMALLAQDPAVMAEFTIREQLEFQARLRSITGDRVAECMDRVGLGDDGDTRLVDASGGMRRRTGLAAALVGDPELVFCDEPTAGLDPIVRDHIWNWFRRRRREGRSMVVTTQHIDEAARCDRVIVLREGEVVADAVPSELARSSGLEEELLIAVAPADRDRTAAIVGDLGSARATAEGIVVTLADASQAAPEAAGLLADAGIEVLELDTRVPGLDEVFRAIVERG